jgi:hypothetical protein
MLGEFLNDVKEEVEDAWNWSQLRKILTFSTSSGVTVYNIGDASAINTQLTVADSDGNLFPLSSIEGYSTADASNEHSQILSMYNTNQDIMMKNMSDDFFNRVTYLGTTQNSDPTYWRTRGYDDQGDMNVEIYPVPNGVHDIKVWTYQPQDELSTDASVLVLTSAERAILYGTWAMAISERGEDGGQLYDEIAKKYNDYLSTAIARDRAMYDSAVEGAEGDWVVV